MNKKVTEIGQNILQASQGKMTVSDLFNFSDLVAPPSADSEKKRSGKVRKVESDEKK